MKKLLLPTLLFSVALLRVHAQEILDLGNYHQSEDLFEGSVFSKCPVNFAYNYSCNQFIYTAAELAGIGDGKINSLQFRCYPGEQYVVYDHVFSAKLYLLETENDVFLPDEDRKYAWYQVDDEHLYYEGDIEVDFAGATLEGEDIDIKLELNRPFAYTGKNLMVMLAKHSEENMYDYDIFIDFYAYPRNVTGMPVRTLYAADDKKVFEDPYPVRTGSGGFEGNGALKQRPVVLIAYSPVGSAVEKDRVEEESNVSVSGRNILVQGREEGIVQVYNTSGQLVFSEKVTGDGSFAIDQTGLFYIRLITQRSSLIKKVHIQ